MPPIRRRAPVTPACPERSRRASRWRRSSWRDRAIRPEWRADAGYVVAGLPAEAGSPGSANPRPAEQIASDRRFENRQHSEVRIPSRVAAIVISPARNRGPSRRKRPAGVVAVPGPKSENSKSRRDD